MNNRGLLEISGWYLTWWGWIIFIISTFVMILAVFTLNEPTAVTEEAFMNTDDILFQTIWNTPYGEGTLGGTIIKRYKQSEGKIQAYQDIHQNIDKIVRKTYDNPWWQLEIQNIKGTERLLKLQSEEVYETGDMTLKKFFKIDKPIPHVYMPTEIKEYPIINISFTVISK